MCLPFANESPAALISRLTFKGLNSTGSFGGASFEFLFNNDPYDISVALAPGYIEFDVADVTLITALDISVVDINNNDVTAYLQTIDDSTSQIKGNIKIKTEKFLEKMKGMNILKKDFRKKKNIINY